MPVFISPYECRCRCCRPTCDAEPIDQEAFAKMVAVRTEWDKPIIFTSIRRCKYYNAKVGGKPDSRHLFGKAFDAWMTDRNEIEALAALAIKYGAGGIGKGKRLLHMDWRPIPPGGSVAEWEYTDK